MDGDKGELSEIPPAARGRKAGVDEASSFLAPRSKNRALTI